MSQPTVVKKLVSLPFDLKQWAELEAERNLSSANSEIVRALREKKDRDEQRQKTAAR